MTIFLKAANEAMLKSALTTAGLMTNEGGYGPTLDPIGMIKGKTGWHVNLSGSEVPAELQAYEIHPATPERVFFGA